MVEGVGVVRGLEGMYELMGGEKFDVGKGGKVYVGERVGGMLGNELGEGGRVGENRGLVVVG